MEGFFSTLELSLIKSPPSLIPKCGSCGLYKDCLSPKMPVTGKGKLGVLIAGEAPGQTEDALGKQFAGTTGTHLERTLDEIGINMRRDCFLTNAVICRPKANKLPNKAVDFCRPNLIKTLNELQPKVVILLGNAAVKSLIAYVWKDDAGGNHKGMTTWAGWNIPCQKPNLWICPTWHPSYCLRELEKRNPVPQQLFKRDLQRSFSLKNKPWKEAPNYRAQVQPIFKADEAAHALAKFKLPIAFDYETDRLKPDESASEILCCAVSDGETTIAYPWKGKAIEATKQLLQSKIPKLGWNMRFEERWSIAKLGVRVNNWVWDGMVNAHVKDNRAGITSLKFQAFVKLGMPDYDSYIKPYMKAKGGNTPNQIKQFVHEHGWESLLVYNGFDALLEHKLCLLQIEEMGMKHVIK